MPKPLKHVFVCQQKRPEGHPRGSCWQQNGQAVLNAFFEELQSRVLFDKIAVTATGCLGPCPFGTSVLVYPEGVMYGKVNKEDVKEIFEQHLLGDVPVERLKVPKEVWS